MASFSRGTRRGGVFVGSARCVAPARGIPFAVVLGLVLAGAGLSRGARAGTLVSFNFANFGTVQVDLFDDLVSTTVNNFVQNYVATGLYSNSMIHRVDTGLGVIQGGGLHADSSSIPTSSPIALQYSRANTRGTISMARTDVLNSATSQWFINTDDNTTDLGQANAGGYAVFGWVVGPGMSVIDNIAAVPVIDYRGVPAELAASWGLQNVGFYRQWPLQDFSIAEANSGANPLPHVVVLSSVTVVKTHPSFQNPYSALDVNNNDFLQSTDALAIISELLTHGSHTLNGPFSGTAYLDTDGNGRVNSADALLVISALLNGVPPQGTPLASPSASPDAMAMASFDGMTMLLVPEPSSLTLLAAFTLSLGGFFLLRKRAWHRHARPAA